MTSDSDVWKVEENEMEFEVFKARVRAFIKQEDDKLETLKALAKEGLKNPDNKAEMEKRLQSLRNQFEMVSSFAQECRIASASKNPDDWQTFLDLYGA